MCVIYPYTVLVAILPHLVKQKSGHIISVSSIQGLVALPERSAYSASKHALQAFNDSLRAEVAKHNIDVTVVSPGYIKTQMSMNALTGSGVAYGKMDSTTENGYTAEYVAEQMVKAVVQKKKELVISTFLPKIAIFLRKYFPRLYFYVMACRAKRTTP